MEWQAHPVRLSPCSQKLAWLIPDCAHRYWVP